MTTALDRRVQIDPFWVPQRVALEVLATEQNGGYLGAGCVPALVLERDQVVNPRYLPAEYVCGGCGDRSVVCVQILQLWRAPPGLQVGANAAELIPVGGCRAVFAGAVLAAAMR